MNDQPGRHPLRLCAYQDRSSGLIGARLLVASLERFHPEAVLYLYHQGLGDDDLAWFRRRSGVHLRQPPAGTPIGWSAKPAVVLDGLQRSQGRVTWIDSDILLLARLPDVLLQQAPQVLVAAEEHRWVRGNGSDARSGALGLRATRVFRRSLNTCVLTVSSYHEPLLKEWSALMFDERYQRAQEQSFDDRPWFFGSDQDMLSALLETNYADIPVVQIASGRHIAQCFLNVGFGSIERVRATVCGLPPMLHAQGPKPWDNVGASFAELSPYTLAAEGYFEVATVRWPTSTRRSSRVLRSCALGSPLAGLPHSMAAELREVAARRERRRSSDGSSI